MNFISFELLFLSKMLYIYIYNTKRSKEVILMKRNTIKRIASILGTMSLFSNSVLAKALSYDDDLYYGEDMDYDVDDEYGDIEEKTTKSNKKNIGLISRGINRVLEKLRGGDENNNINLSYGQETVFTLLSIIAYENIKSGLRYSKYEDNSFSAQKLDEEAAKSVGNNPLEKLKWIIEYLHEKNSIKFGSIDALTIPKYPLFLLWKSKFLNLFVPKDRSTLQKDMEYASTLYQTLGTAICADNAKILYLWARCQGLPAMMFIEDVHCYTMIKIDGKWYRTEPLSPGTERWKRIYTPEDKELPYKEGYDKKVLLIKPDEDLNNKTWEATEVWDLDTNNMPSWGDIYNQISKNNPKEGIPQDRISSTKDLKWQIQWWY